MVSLKLGNASCAMSTCCSLGSTMHLSQQVLTLDLQRGSGCHVLLLCQSNQWYFVLKPGTLIMQTLLRDAPLLCSNGTAQHLVWPVAGHDDSLSMLYYLIATCTCVSGLLVCCRTPLIASAAANAVNLSLDLFFVFVAGWGVVGAASAATIGQYVGLATMLFMLCWKGVLHLSDLRTLPSPQELKPMAQVLYASACIAVWCCCMS